MSDNISSIIDNRLVNRRC